MSEQIRLIPGREPGAIVASAAAMHSPSKMFVLFSGGKDSSVTLDYFWRNHPELLTGALHINTGIGLQSTTAFARKFCEERYIPFHEARAPLSYEDIVAKYGFPGPSAHGKMYVWLKERALDAFVGLQKSHRLDNIALVTGVRAEESKRRMGTTLDISKDGSKIWVAPLIDYSNRDMVRHRDEHSVPMSPASSTIHVSAECLCGAFGDPSELDTIETFYPEDPAVPRIRALERKLALDGNPRCKWATALPDDVAPLEAPGPLCVGCYKHPTEDAA